MGHGALARDELPGRHDRVFGPTGGVGAGDAVRPWDVAALRRRDAVEHPGIDQNGNPSIFGNTSASSSFADEFPGHSGTRAPVTGFWMGV